MSEFKFNLLPKKTKEVIIKEDKRDRASVYTAVLPLIAVLFWLGLVLFNGLVINKVKEDWNLAIADKQRKIDQDYLPVRVRHGELVVKTRSLAGLVQRDIQPESLFILTEKIFPNEDPNIRIVGYGRETDGKFTINIETSEYTKFAEITRRFSNFDAALNVNISSVSNDPKTGKISGTISFYLDLESLNNG
jgi:hypothetical protein